MRVPSGTNLPSGSVTPPGGTRRGVRDAAGDEYRRPSLITADYEWKRVPWLDR